MHVYDIVSLDGEAWEMTKRMRNAECTPVSGEIMGRLANGMVDKRV